MKTINSSGIEAALQVAMEKILEKVQANINTTKWKELERRIEKLEGRLKLLNEQKE